MANETTDELWGLIGPACRDHVHYKFYSNFVIVFLRACLLHDA